MPRGRYNTQHRAELTEFFRSHPDDMFSAKQLIDRLSPGIGEATIYRSLVGLTAEGVLERTLRESGRALYQYNRKHDCTGHLHLQCTRCREMFCTDADLVMQLDERLGFEVDSEQTTIYGVCAKCRAQSSI